MTAKCNHCNWDLRQGFTASGLDYWCVNPDCPALGLLQLPANSDNLLVEYDENGTPISDEIPEEFPDA